MTMPPQPPPGQGPIDPRGAFSSGPPGPPPPPQNPGLPPMSMMMPPPVFYPPPPPPRAGGFARTILLTLASSIFGLSIALNIYLLILTGVLGGRTGSADETVLVSGDPAQTIAVVSIDGEIDDRSSERFDSLVKQFEGDSNVKAVVVELNTPGGSVSASDEIYHRILKLKEDKRIPVVASMKGLAASGGYYVACAADQIVAGRTTITGSIGVVMPRYDLSKLADKYGVVDDSLHATGATFKTTGSMFKPLVGDDRAYLLSILDDAFAIFKDVVQKGRGASLSKPIDEIANGKVYTGNEAKSLGLVDQLGYESDAYDKAASLAKLTNKQVVRYEERHSFFESLGVGAQASLASGSNARWSAGARGGGGAVNVSIDPSLIERFATPRLMYIWRGE